MAATKKRPQIGCIDRIEGAIAVVEVGRRARKVPRTGLAPEAREGDWVDLATGKVLPARTELLRRKVRAARQAAVKKAPSRGHFDL